MIRISEKHFIVRADKYNLAIIKGEPKLLNAEGKPIPHSNQVIGFYGSVQDAFKKAIDIAVREGEDELNHKNILQVINDLKSHIDAVCCDVPTMLNIMKGI